MNSMKRSRILRIVFSVVIVLSGIILVIFSGPSQVGQIVNSLGFAAIVAGIMSVFREIAILRLETEETGEDIAFRVHKRLQDFPPNARGLKLLVSERRGYAGYYTWVTKNIPQNLFFAGRSVLHRIDFDLKGLNLGSVEEALKMKLDAGSNISILFLDPRPDIIMRFAREEGQTSTQLLSDIAVSIGVCERLCRLLDESNVNPHAHLQIRLYDEIPYFAYHKEDTKVIIGFYFVTALGWESPAYEILDDESKNLFERHFTTIFDRSSGKIILELIPGRRSPTFNKVLYEELRNEFKESMDAEKVDRLMGGG